MTRSEHPAATGVNRWLYTGFSALWMLLILATYWAFHPYYSLSLSEGINYDILLVLLLLCGGAQAWLQFSKRQYNGIMVYGFVLLLQGVTVALYGSKQDLFEGSALGSGLFFMGFNLMLHAALFAIILVMHSAGEIVVKRLSPWYARGSQRILSIAVGTSLVGFVLLLLGLAGLLYGWLLAALFLALLALRWKPSLDFVKTALIKPIKKREENPLWQIPIYLLLISIAINGIYAIKLFPIGFDGAGLYMNTTHLISEYNALPQGGQAFNWQVFLSLGELLYGEMSLTMMMAHLSGLLCLFALYRLARLFLPRQMAWLAGALFYLSPAVNFHLTLDEKVDLGFLFISLSTLLLLLEYRLRLSGKKKLPQGQPLFQLAGRSMTEQHLIWLLTGWLAGYAFGIKYTGIMSVFALLSYMAYQRAGAKAGMGTLALLLSLLFLTGVYQFGYLELGDTLPIAVAGLSLAAALPLLFFGWRRKNAALRSFAQSIALLAAGGFLVFSPWMGKHLLENKRLGLSALVEGKSPEPVVRVNLQEKKGKTLFERISQKLEKRGVELSPEQQRQTKAMIREYQPQIDAFRRGELSEEEREKYIRQVRRRFEREVLTAQQIAQIGLSAVTGSGGPGVGEAALLESGKREEVKRYIGYESGFPLYLSLPYDASMNTNVRFLKYLDIGFLLLFFFPLLLFNWRGKWSLGKNAGLLVLLLLFWGISVFSLYANGTAAPTEVELRNAIESLANKHHAPFDGIVEGLFGSIQTAFIALMRPLQSLYASLSGWSFFLSFISVLALSALSYGLMRERLSGLSRNFKAMLAFALSFAFFWLLLGSGIAWYAFPVWAILSIVLVYFIHKPERLAPAAPVFSRGLLLGGAGLSLLLHTVLNFMSTTEAESNASMRFQNAFVKYAATTSSKQEARFEFNPVIVELRKIINRDEESQVYRVGTHFNYHITRNDQRVYEDNQLGLFEEYTSSGGNPREFLSFLKRNGFRYVLFDLNTAGMDETPEQSLAKKANRFYRLLVNTPQAQLLFTDNLVEAPQGSRSRLGRMKLSGRLALQGQTKQPGTFALFELR